MTIGPGELKYPEQSHITERHLDKQSEKTIVLIKRLRVIKGIKILKEIKRM